MKVRIWTGKSTLASENGANMKNFEQFELWLKSQPDGQIEVWAGRWFVVSREARPFVIESGNCFCNYRPYFGNLGQNPRNFPGFFAYEAWRIASRVSNMWMGIGSMASSMLDVARKDKV